MLVLLGFHSDPLTHSHNKHASPLSSLSSVPLVCPSLVTAAPAPSPVILPPSPTILPPSPPRLPSLFRSTSTPDPDNRCLYIRNLSTNFLGGTLPSGLGQKSLIKLY